MKHGGRTRQSTVREKAALIAAVVQYAMRYISTMGNTVSGTMIHSTPPPLINSVMEVRQKPPLLGGARKMGPVTGGISLKVSVVSKSKSLCTGCDGPASGSVEVQAGSLAS